MANTASRVNTCSHNHHGGRAPARSDGKYVGPEFELNSNNERVPVCASEIPLAADWRPTNTIRRFLRRKRGKHKEGKKKKEARLNTESFPFEAGNIARLLGAE